MIISEVADAKLSGCWNKAMGDDNHDRTRAKMMGACVSIGELSVQLVKMKHGILSARTTHLYRLRLLENRPPLTHSEHGSLEFVQPASQHGSESHVSDSGQHGVHAIKGD